MRETREPEITKLRALCRSRREYLGLSLRAVESASGVSFAAIAKFERGEHELSLRHAVRLMRFYEIKPDAVFNP